MWVRQIFHLLPRARSFLISAALFAFSIEVLKLVPPYLMKIAIDLLVLPNPVFLEVSTYIAGILIVSLATTLLEVKFFNNTAMSCFGLETDILRKGHRKLMQLGLSYHESHPTGEQVHLMNKGSGRLADLSWFISDQFLGASFQILLTALLLLWVDFWCGLIFTLFMPVVIFLVHRSGKKVQPYRETYHDKFREAAWEMNQSLLNVRTVKDYVQENQEERKYNQLLDEYLRLADIRIKLENKDIRNRDFLLGVARFTVLFYAVYLVVQGSMTAGTLVLFATLSEKAVASLYRLGRLYSHLGDSMESIKQFAELFGETADIKDTPSAISCPKLDGRIEFKDVSFSYQDDAPAIYDVNLIIPAKQVIAFVGRSGAGKTTMIKLLSRHYDVTGGAVLVDGHDIRSIKVEEYRKKISVVSQDIEIFDTDLWGNISYGTDATKEQIMEVAKVANAAEFIEELPQGYNTRVGERGVKLSGGQRQRIGIARALIMDPAILIFDEATSSLDTESERLIQESLQKIAHRQTMIVIAHRFSTIENADIVVVFEDGRIIEQGSPSELVDEGGRFAEMRRLQQLGEIRA